MNITRNATLGGRLVHFLERCTKPESVTAEAGLPYWQERALYGMLFGAASVGFNERILFVDDEPAIGKLLSLRLKGLGYSVTVFTDPEMALSRFQEQPESFDLLILDRNMPMMSGRKLMKEVRRIRSDIPCILCSGIPDEQASALAESEQSFAFCLKPVPLPELAKTIRDCLGQLPDIT